MSLYYCNICKNVILQMQNIVNYIELVLLKLIIVTLNIHFVLRRSVYILGYFA